MNNEDRIFDLLEKVYIELQDTKSELKSEIKKNRDSIGNLESEVKENRTSINSLESQIKEFREETNDRLDKVSEDLEFLIHKEFETEKEVYNLKKKLSGHNKRNVK